MGAAKAMLQAGFDRLAAVVGTVPVVNGEHTAQAIVRYGGDGEFGMRGVDEPTTGRGRVKADALGELSRDTAITVDGKTVYVTSHQTDSAGATTFFDFTTVSPATAEDML